MTRSGALTSPRRRRGCERPHLGGTQTTPTQGASSGHTPDGSRPVQGRGGGAQPQPGQPAAP